jgi:hypothetical protein
MWKHFAEGFTRSLPVELNLPALRDWPWRKILADAGLVAGFALTSSWLMR